MPKKRGDRSKLTATDREVISQTFAVTDSKAETARRCGVSVQSVYNVLARADEAGTDMKVARADAAIKLANKTHVKVEELMDSISAVDIESGRIPIKDKDGKITGYRYFGPSLLQKATAIGILTDKANVLQTYEKSLAHDAARGDLMLPDDIAGLVGAIQAKVGELSILNIKFADDNPNLVRETQEVVAEVKTIEEEAANQPDVVTFDEFDN